MGFHDMTTLECHRFYGPWRWQEVTQHSIAHWCEEVRHYVEPCGALLVDFQVLEQ